MRMSRGMASVGLALATLGVSAPVAAAPAPGAIQIDGKTAGWILDPSIKGLVTLHQNGPTVTLSFHLFGLKPSRQYRLVAHAETCGTAGETVFRRGFSSNAQGVAWDPVGIDADASDVQSIRVRDVPAGKVVACSDSPFQSLSTAADGVKLDFAGVRGVAILRDAGPSLRVALSISGLKPDARYRLVGREGTCADPGALTFELPFRANAKGRALPAREVDAVTAGSLQTGALRIRAVASGTTVGCEATD